MANVEFYVYGPIVCDHDEELWSVYKRSGEKDEFVSDHLTFEHAYARCCYMTENYS